MPRSSNAASAAALPVAMVDSAVTEEFALLLQGQTLRIQIGDVSASRKAWKKRRRNVSPILIPCSILGMNRAWMVRGNLVALLHQIGEESSVAGGKVGATVDKLKRTYRQRLGGDLRDHATALGYDSVESLLRSLFGDGFQADGIQTFVEPQHGNLMLTTSLKRHQARSLSSSAGLVQFRPETGDDGYALEGNEKMIHTGMSSVRLSSSLGKRPQFTQEPLGAALRVQPGDEVAGRYQPGDELNAFCYQYNVEGDNESPLLVLTADDPRGKGASTGGGRALQRRGGHGSLADDAGIERDLTELSAGDGPFAAAVVTASPRSGAAFVDCGVGRTRGKKRGGRIAKVLGMLRFDDVERGEGAAASGHDCADIAAGDELQVYIKAVSPQSGRFMVTLDPSIKNKKSKDIKREKQAEKRKERLWNKISQEDIKSSIGNVYEGIVKAKSKTGDWYYVQPCADEEATTLPIGVATFLTQGAEKGGNNNNEPYSAGDRVRVRLEGMDEKRGQLSLTLMND